MIWTGFDLPQYASFALRAGAAGFVVKTAPLDELVTAIRTAAAGGLHFTRTADVEPRDLSHRERAILGHVIAGRSNDEIAATMGLTTRAVEAHLTRMYQRFHVGSRTELATRALQEAWLDLPHESTAVAERPGT